jgi:hypothetical protein
VHDRSTANFQWRRLRYRPIHHYRTATGLGICTLGSFHHAARFDNEVGVPGDGIKSSASSTLVEPPDGTQWHIIAAEHSTHQLDDFGYHHANVIELNNCRLQLKRAARCSKFDVEITQILQRSAPPTLLDFHTLISCPSRRLIQNNGIALQLGPARTNSIVMSRFLAVRRTA